MARDVIVHCSDSPHGRGDNANTIDKWHKERGFDCIGYHFVILEDGTIEEGRDLHKMGAHTFGFNDCIGICLIGRYSFTDEQFSSLKALCKKLKPIKVMGHCEVSHKSCPNFDVSLLNLEEEQE